MQKRIKIFFAILVVMTLIFGVFNINHAAIKEVTKDSLTKAVSNVNSKIEMYIGFSSSVSDGVIKVTTNGKTYDLKYDLSSNPTFTSEFTIKKGMSYNDYTQESLAEEMPIIGYISLATANGASFRDVILYAMTMYAKVGKASNNYQLIDDVNNGGVVKEDRSDIIYASDFGERGVEYTKDLYSEGSSSNDKGYIDSYTWTIKKVNETDTSCTISSKIVINSNTNFAALSEEEPTVATETTTQENAQAPAEETVEEPAAIENEHVETVSGTQTENNNTEVPNVTVSSVTNENTTTPTPTPITYSRSDVAAQNNTNTTGGTTNTNNTNTTNSTNKNIVLPYAGENDMAVMIAVLLVIAVACGIGYVKYKNI